MSDFIKILIGISVIVAVINLIIPSGKLKKTLQIFFSIMLSLILIINVSNVKFGDIKIFDNLDQNYNYSQEFENTNALYNNFAKTILDKGQITYKKVSCNYGETGLVVTVTLSREYVDMQDKIIGSFNDNFVFKSAKVNLVYE